MILPNFLLLGAQKCGTTWLHEQLNEHPEILMSSTKEIHFFNVNSNYKRGLKFYSSFFNDYSNQKIIGESTPNYFWIGKHHDQWLGKGINPKVTLNLPKRIRKDLGPNTKFLLLLRNPVERAISAYYHQLKFNDRINLQNSFEENITHYGIVHMGFYASHLKHYLKEFSKDQFFISIYERFFAEPAIELKKILKFLEVDSSFQFSNLSKNIHSSKKKKMIGEEYYIKPDEDSTPRKIISKTDIELLRDIYKKPNQELISILGDNLEEWNT